MRCWEGGGHKAVACDVKKRTGILSTSIARSISHPSPPLRRTTRSSRLMYTPPSLERKCKGSSGNASAIPWVSAADVPRRRILRISLTGFEGIGLEHPSPLGVKCAIKSATYNPFERAMSRSWRERR